MAIRERRTTSEWTGIRGRIGAWYLNSPLRRLSEMLFLGDCKTACISLVSQVIQGDEAVLDVGAGSGYFSLAIAKQLSTGKVICLDLSEEMLQRLERKAEKEGLRDRIQLLRGEAASSGLERASVDLVVSNGVFHELRSPEVALGEMLRVLKPHGWVIVTDFRDTRVGKRIGAAHSEDAHGPFSVGELEALFTRAGLRDVKVTSARHWVIGICKKPGAQIGPRLV